MLHRLYRFLLAFFRIDLDEVCRLAERSGWDFHDYPDDELGYPEHFIPLQCKRCKRSFRL